KPLREFGIGAWYSGDSIAAGKPWVTSIHEGLDQSQWVVVVVSRESKTSKRVKQEIEIAAAKENLLNRIIPVRLDDSSLEEVHPHLQHMQSLDAREKPAIADRLKQRVIAQRK